MNRELPEKDHPDPDQDQLRQLVARFESENADLLEAMHMFGISNAEYERAIRALYGSPVFTSSST